MSELGLDTRYNLVDMAKLTVNQELVEVANVLAESNEMLADMPLYAANEITSMTGARITSLPTPTIVKVGDGWDASKAAWEQFKEGLSSFKMRIQVPSDVLKLQPNPVGQRIMLERSSVEGFTQGVANHMVYGTSAAAPEKFDGLDVRYKTPSTANDGKTLTNSAHYGVYDMAGTGSTTSSIWMIQWSPAKVHGIYPRNHVSLGITAEDKGQVLVTAENSKSRWDYITELEWWMGLAIRDVRAVKRIRNISVALSAISTDLAKLIIQARNDFYGSEPVWLYCNRRIFTHLDILGTEKQNVRYSSDNPYGKPMMMFRDMPIRKSDAILDTETAVTAV